MQSPNVPKFHRLSRFAIEDNPPPKAFDFSKCRRFPAPAPEDGPC